MRYIVLVLLLAGCSNSKKESEPEPHMGPALPAVEVAPLISCDPPPDMPVANG